MRKPARASGMALWEWLAILALVSGFAVVLWAGARRAPLVDRARDLKNQLEEIDRAIREAEAAGKKPGDGVWDSDEYLPLLGDKHARLRASGLDPFGNPHGPVKAGGRPGVPAATAAQTAGTIHPTFWSPFAVADTASLPPHKPAAPPPP